MTTQDIIKEILSKNPELSEARILQKLNDEKARTGGLLGDETLLRLIAAKCGVEVEQNGISNSGSLRIGGLCAGLNDVTVAGRLIAVSPIRTFEGEKQGKFATLMIADDEGVLRVVLWNERANLVESGELNAGQAIRLLHGYTRQDRYGKVELHLGGKSRIEVEPAEKAASYPAVEKFTTKIGSLNSSLGSVNLSGTVKDVSGVNGFRRSDDSEGNVMRFTISDDSGQVVAVAWNEKAVELVKILKVDLRLLLVNARVKEAKHGGFEVHVDSNTYVDVHVAGV